MDSNANRIVINRHILKKSYVSPELRIYGAVRNITQGGTKSGTEKNDVLEAQKKPAGL